MQPEPEDYAYLADTLQMAWTARRMTEGLSFGAYEADRQLKLAVERCLEIIGEAASHVSSQFRGAHPEIPWRLIVDQRNILIHGYSRIQNRRIWGVLTDDLPELIAQLEPLASPTGEP